MRLGISDITLKHIVKLKQHIKYKMAIIVKRLKGYIKANDMDEESTTI